MPVVETAAAVELGSLAVLGICFSVVVAAVVVVVVCESLAVSVFLVPVPISVSQQLHVL